MASEYLYNHIPPVWNTVENVNEIKNIINREIHDWGRDTMFCVGNNKDREDSETPGVVKINVDMFGDDIGLYKDILQWDGTPMLTKKLTDIADSDSLAFLRIKTVAGIVKNINLNKSIFFMLNDTFVRTTVVKNMCDTVREEHQHLIDHVKKQLPAIKSKYTRNKKEIPEEIGDSFDVADGIQCNWSLSLRDIGNAESTLEAYKVSFVFNNNRHSQKKQRDNANIDTYNRMQFFYNEYNVNEGFKLLLTAKNKHFLRFSSDVRASCPALEWEQAVSLMYVLSTASGDKNEIDVVEMGNAIKKIFNNIREQTDKHMLVLVDNINKNPNNRKKTSMSNADVIRAMSEISDMINKHASVFGSATSVHEVYAHEFILPEIFNVDGRNMIVKVNKPYHDHVVNINIKIKGDDDKAILHMPIRASTLTGKADIKSYDYRGEKLEMAKKVLSLVTANVEQFLSCFSVETKNHIAKNQLKIEQTEEDLYNDFPEECMDMHLSMSLK
jgi:hypothetical protein